jgi:hypothetical protein
MALEKGKNQAGNLQRRRKLAEIAMKIARIS